MMYNFIGSEKPTKMILYNDPMQKHVIVFCPAGMIPNNTVKIFTFLDNLLNLPHGRLH
jgi:hypothetical protein